MYVYLGHVPSGGVGRHDVVVEDLEDLPLELLHVLSLDVKERRRRGDELDQRRLGGHLVGLCGAVTAFGRSSNIPGDTEVREGVEGDGAQLGFSVGLKTKLNDEILSFCLIKHSWPNVRTIPSAFLK